MCFSVKFKTNSRGEMCYLIHYCHGVPCLIELKVFCSVRAKVANNGKKLTKAEKKTIEKTRSIRYFQRPCTPFHCHISVGLVFDSYLQVLGIRYFQFSS